MTKRILAVLMCVLLAFALMTVALANEEGSGQETTPPTSDPAQSEVVESEETPPASEGEDDGVKQEEHEIDEGDGHGEGPGDDDQGKTDEKEPEQSTPSTFTYVVDEFGDLILTFHGEGDMPTITKYVVNGIELPQDDETIVMQIEGTTITIHGLTDPITSVALTAEDGAEYTATMEAPVTEETPGQETPPQKDPSESSAPDPSPAPSEPAGTEDPQPTEPVPSAQPTPGEPKPVPTDASGEIGGGNGGNGPGGDGHDSTGGASDEASSEMAPKTGDASNIIVWSVLALFCGGMLAGTVIYVKKHD